MNPAPLHIRFVGRDENEPDNIQIYVHGNLAHERPDLSPADMTRLFADVYGMPTTMDKIEAPPAEPLTVLTADHLNNPVLFDAIGYDPQVFLGLAHRAFGRALNNQLILAAKKVGITAATLPKAVRIGENPESLGNDRVYAVQRMIDPAYAFFVATITWIPNSAGFYFNFSDIEVQAGEFGKGA